MVKLFGAALLFLSLSTALSIGHVWRPWSGTFSAGGMLGLVLADALRGSLNFTGSLLLTFVCLILSLYLVSTFSMSVVARLFRVPMNYVVILRVRWDEWREQRREAALERARRRAERIAAANQEAEAESIPISEPVSQQFYEPEEAQPAPYEEIPIHELEEQQPEEIPAPVAAEPMEHVEPREPSAAGPATPRASTAAARS